eukprot:m.307857 g.307857  ORF g.307857 m.307857 type:complete len:191 (+) comp55324_c0_seq3:120-692(+)
MGPATSNDEAAFEYLCQFAQSVKQYTDALSVFTYHHYYGPGPGLNISYFYNVTVMDSLIAILEAGQHCTQTIPDIEVWLGETATTALGGTEGISDTFVNGFLWSVALFSVPSFHAPIQRLMICTGSTSCALLRCSESRLQRVRISTLARMVCWVTARGRILVGRLFCSFSNRESCFRPISGQFRGWHVFR